MNNIYDKFEKYLKYSGLNVNKLDGFFQLYIDSCELDPNRKITGVDIYRNFEYLLSLNYLKPNKMDVILDIGSRDTIWATMIVKRFGSRVYSTDISSEFFDTQKYFLSNIGEQKCLGKVFFIKKEDATKLSFKNESFDKITAISIIEHIPGEGDIRAVKEFERVVKKGGYVIITAPFGPEFNERNSDYYGGYEKRYDYNNLESRIIKSSGLKLRELAFINGNSDNSDSISDYWYSNKLYSYFGYASMFFSMGMFNVTEQPNERSRGFVVKLVKE